MKVSSLFVLPVLPALAKTTSIPLQNMHWLSVDKVTFGASRPNPLVEALKIDLEDGFYDRAEHLSLPDLLKQPFGINTPLNDDGFTLVNSFAADDNLEAVRWLTQHNADVTIPNKKGYTPLMQVASHGNIDMMHEILPTVPNAQLGDYINARTTEGDQFTALTIALKRKYWRFADSLIAMYSADPLKKTGNGLSPFMVAVGAGGEKFARKLKTKLGRACNVNDKSAAGDTALMHTIRGYAASQNKRERDEYFEIIKWLIQDLNASLNLGNKDDWTPLVQASSDGLMDVVELILETKYQRAMEESDPQKLRAAICVQDNKGFTSLERASQNGHLKTVNMILKYVNLYCELAAPNDKAEQARLRREIIDTQDSNKYTALMQLASTKKAGNKWNFIAVAKALLAAGADPTYTHPQFHFDIPTTAWNNNFQEETDLHILLLEAQNNKNRLLPAAYQQWAQALITDSH